MEGKTLQKPARLCPGDVIGVAAPSGPLGEERTLIALEALRRRGYVVKAGKHASRVHGYLAGDDAGRASDLQALFADPEVKAIFCLKGGYGTSRILDRLDYAEIAKNPKIFVGYSDITGLHLALSRHAGLVTFHGPMVSELAIPSNHPSATALFRVLTDPAPVGELAPEDADRCTIHPGTAEGVLVGGNLSLIASMVGTPYAIDATDRILLLEDVGEYPYRVDRMLNQLRLAGILESARAIVLSDFTDCETEPEGPPALSLRDVFEEVIGPLGIPAYYGLKAGHCKPNLALPLGVCARVDAARCTLALLEGGVR